jgi:methyl coenzyme M reductase subunit C-like uncharacterized protein (methanogenesis marker protein 7)
MNYSYDELYGVDLNEYLKFHNKTKNQLEKEIERDIKLLKSNLDKLIKERDITDPLIGSVYELLKKKSNHLKRIRKWKK